MDITDYIKINDEASHYTQIFNKNFLELHKKLLTGKILKEGVNKYLNLNCIEKKINILTCTEEDFIYLHIRTDNRNIVKFDMVIEDVLQVFNTSAFYNLNKENVKRSLCICCCKKFTEDK